MNRAGVAILVVVLLALAPSCGTARRRAAKRQRRQVVLAQLMARQAELSMRLQEAQAIRAEQAAVMRVLPGEADTPTLFQRMEVLAEQQSITVRRLEHRADLALGDLVASSIKVELEGPFGAVVDWIRGVTGDGRAVTLEDLELTFRVAAKDRGLVDAKLGLRAYRLGEAPPPPAAPGFTIDKEFADDPEIARLYAQTKDLDRIRGVVADLQARMASVEEILTEAERAPALLSHLASLQSAASLDSITIRRKQFTIQGRAPDTTEVVHFLKLVQESPSATQLTLDSDREVPDPTGKHPQRLFSLSGEFPEK